jgi:hypothetical protein
MQRPNHVTKPEDLTHAQLWRMAADEYLDDPHSIAEYILDTLTEGDTCTLSLEDQREWYRGCYDDPEVSDDELIEYTTEETK